ncbi:MAG: radical SAM protein [Thermococcus sp.]|uniref:radical SAM protein n=1 Tax=Thermococcus sp. TaxID=35749 RepID=UPI001D2F40F8|nr:radical SAM protein [Thermococcus sp.]MBO8174528.1 radical SAM protein [Thermococcus sp.]
MLIRVSYGTAVAMELIKAKMLAKPTTAYLMIYHNGRCINNCAFCPQARESKADLSKLSRITWPVFELKTVLEKLKEGRFSRICLQTVDYEGLEEDVLTLLGAFYNLNLPISVSITPVDREYLEKFRELGVDYIGVGLDVASKRLYRDIKDSLYSWNEMWDFADEIIEIFGKGKAFVHLIIGLGETDKEAIETIQRAYDIGAEVSLFAFTPIKGTKLENLKPPSLIRYRKIQIGHYLIKNRIKRAEEFEFDNDGSLLSFGMNKKELMNVLSEMAVMTHGCPGCNRPYYNEKPSKEPYNFPIKPKKEYLTKVIEKIFGEA